MDKGLTLTDSQVKAVMTDRISNRIRVVLDDSAGTILTPISVSCDGNTGVQWKIKVKTGDSSEGAAAGVGATVQWSCDGSTWLTLMTGHIDDNGAVRNQGYVFDDTLTCTIVDMTSYKGTKRKPSSTAYAGYYICNPGNPDKSLVHILGRMMGVTAFDVGDLSAYVKDIVELGSNSVWQELQDIAECYDADLAFTADGKLYFHSPLEAGWTGKTPDWTLVASREQEGKVARASSVIGSISRTAPSATCNRAKSTFSTYERGTAGVIYRDTTNWNEATKTCHITIPGKTRYPESGYLSLKYKDPDSGEEYPYAVNVETPKIGGRGYPIYAVGGRLKLISFDGSTADTQKVSGESQIVLYNDSSDTCTIEGLQIYGIPYRKTAESTVEEIDSTVTDEIDYVTQEIDGKYATDATQLSAVLSRLVAKGKTIHRIISLETSFLPQVQVGEVMRLVTDDEDDIWEVKGYKHTMKGAQMSTLRTSLDLIEVTDYTPAAAPKTVVRHPQTARQTTAQTQIEYAAWANADLPPVPNGTYVIDGVASTITDSSLSQDEAEGYWSTDGSPDTQPGDFIWMRTRTGGDTWIYQIVTSRREISSISYTYAVTSTQDKPDDATSTTIPILSETNKYLWQKELIAYNDGATHVNIALIAVYGDKGDRGAAGETGPTGWSQATLQLFKRSATAPAKYDGSALTYTFSTATLAGNKGSWSITIPSGSDPLYVIYAPAFGQGETDIVETSDWTVPAILSENGTRGENGDTVATVMLYQRSASTPSKPSGVVTYNFLSGAVSNTGSWSNTVPASNGNPLWVITAVASVTGSSNVHEDTIQPSEWSTPSIMAKDGEQGPQGEQGPKGDKGATGAIGPQGPQGAKGETGATGTSIIGIVEEYALSSSSSSVTGTWGSSVPTLTSTNKYLWNRSKTKYSDGTTSAYTTAVVIGVYGDTGKTGATGAQGPQGAKGEKGDTGETGPQGPQGATGSAGRGISSITEYYLASASSTAPSSSDTGWSTSAQTPTEAKPYLWNKTVVTYTSGSPTTTIAMIGQSIKGNPGATGATGNGIKSVTVTYGVSSSASTQPTSWSSTIPAVAENQFLWTRTITDYTNDAVADTVTYTYAKQGKSGSAGTSVTVSSILYQAGTSATTAPTGTWSNNPVSVAQGQFLWTKTTFSDGKVAYGVARQGTDGKPGGTGATGRGISSISHYYATTATQSAPSASSITSTTIPAMSASKKYLWRKTVITYTDSTNSHSVELIAVYGDTGDSASIKDFDLDLSAKAFSVSPRGYTRTAETIVATCTLIHVAANTVTITWSSTSSQVTLTPSSDKTTCTISVAARVALLPFRISCAVTGIGLTKTISVDVQPETGNAYSPIYLGTNWDTSKSWSNSNDPIFSGDYYLDTSTNTPMIASVASNGTITYSAMQTGNPNTALIMGNVLSDILAQGSGVQSTCVAVNAYFGAIAAKTGFIKSLRSQVIQSTNYTYEGMDEGKPETDASWPVSGWELDGPNNVIKSVGLRSAGGEFHDVNITSGNITITDSDMNTILATVKDDAPSKLSGSVTADYYLVDEVVASSGMAENAETSIACRYDGASYPIAVRATKEINYSFYYSNAYIDTTKEYESVTVVLNDTKKDVVIYAGHINNSERRIKLVQLFLTSPSGTITTLYHDIDGASGSKTFSVGTLPIGTSIEAIFGCYVVGQGGYRQGPLLEGMFTVTASGNTYSAGNLYLLDSSFNIAVTLPLSSYLSHTSHPLVVGSASSSAKYSMVSDFIATLSVGNFQIDQSKTMTYSDGIYGSITQLATVTVTNNSITMTRSGASPISYYSGGVIVGSPSLSVYAVTRLKGATVYNLNRADENSLVGTAPKPFANVWTQNLNNVPVTDSNNQSLAVSGASSIVGAVNQINRDLGSHLAPEIVTNAYGFGFRLGNVIINCLNGTTQNTWNQLWKLPIPYTSTDTYSVVGSCGYNTKRPAMIAYRVSADTVQAGMDQITVISLICIGY